MGKRAIALLCTLSLFLLVFRYPSQVFAEEENISVKEEKEVTQAGDALAELIGKSTAEQEGADKEIAGLDLLTGITNDDLEGEEISYIVSEDTDAPGKQEESTTGTEASVAEYGCLVKGSLPEALDRHGMAYDSVDYAVDTPVGNVNEEYLAEYSKVKWSANYTKSELKLMASLIYCEALDMGFEAMVAVGNVVLNRLKSKSWSHCTTIKEIIYDKKWGVQFSPAYDGNPTLLSRAMTLYSSMDPDVYEPWQIRCMNNSIEAAKAVLRGYKTVPDTFEYFNSHIEKTKKQCQEKGWSFMIIEKHIYYGHTTLDDVLGIEN